MSFEEQLMFKSNGTYCVYYSSNVFCKRHTLHKLGIILGYSPVLAVEYKSHGRFRPIAHKRKHLDGF